MTDNTKMTLCALFFLVMWFLTMTAAHNGEMRPGRPVLEKKR
jgi:hypothetical protein